MSQILIEKIQAARLQQVDAGGITFTVRRPTDLEMSESSNDALSRGEILRRYVVDWNAKEIDLVAGGTPKPVPFSSDLFMEWVADKPNLWAPLIDAIVHAYRQHQEAMEQELGKLDAG